MIINSASGATISYHIPMGKIIMLEDLKLLARYYGRFAAVWPMEALVQEYGQDAVQKAIDKGELELKRSACIAESREMLCWPKNI